MNNQNVKISFIPKEPLLRGDVIVRKRPMVGVSFFVSLLIFAIAFVVAGGVYVYKENQYTKLTELQEQLKETNDQLEASHIIQSIDDLRTLRDQIDNVSIVLDKHIAMSALFNFLGTTTLTTVSFSSFSVTVTEDGKATISMSGQAKSFTDIANQSELYGSRSDILHSFNLNNFELTKEGTVLFDFTGIIDLEKLYYTNTVVGKDEKQSEETPPIESENNEE